MALPAEHGGWGLTLEPGLLGLLMAPSAAGVCVALAALVAFLARTPLKVVVVDATAVGTSSARGSHGGSPPASSPSSRCSRPGL